MENKFEVIKSTTLHYYFNTMSYKEREPYVLHYTGSDIELEGLSYKGDIESYLEDIEIGEGFKISKTYTGVIENNQDGYYIVDEDNVPESMFWVEKVDEIEFIQALDSYFDKSTFKEIFNEYAFTNLQIERCKKGLTVEVLSELADVPAEIIEIYESRQSNINDGNEDVILRLAEALTCDISDILED